MKLRSLLIVTVILVLTGRFNTASAQTFSTLYNFGSVTNGSIILDGRGPNSLIAGSDGNLYGTTGGGGSNDVGTMFKLTSQGTLTTLYRFCAETTIRCPGAPEKPRGIIEGTDGNFYGTSNGGGDYGGSASGGTVFQITPQGTLTVLHSFCSITNVGGYCADGTLPDTPLIEGSDSNFYGTTYNGGSNGWGTIFQITPQGTLTTLYNFDAGTDGYEPNTPLVQGSDGNFYGTMNTGGSQDDGIVYQITSAGTFTVVYNFCTSTNPVAPCEDGSGPLAALIAVGDNLYGTVRDGGLASQEGLIGGGIVFGMPVGGLPNGALVPLYSFCNDGSCTVNGFGPDAPLVYGSDGNFYGTTAGGGGHNGGTVFQLTPEGTLTTLHVFCSETNSVGCLDGSLVVNTVEYPLVQGCDGNFYGIAGGGSNNCGIVYKIDMGLPPLSCTNRIGGGGSGCTYTLHPTNAVFLARGGVDVVDVLASNGCAWSAMSNDGFITILTGTNGTGNGTVHYSVAANTSTNEQVGTMTIADQTFTVTEEGTSTSTGGGCTYSIGTKTSVTLAAKGGKGSISVKVKGTDCPWIAVSNDPFITIVSGSSGTGSGKVDFTVPGNTNTTALSGTMTIAGETFTVNQAAGGCTFKLSPKDGKLKAAGGSATIKVKPNFTDCDWTAVSNDPFITITAGSSGTGAGVVTYSVPANTNTTAVTGSITIGGQTFNVTEAAPK